MFAATLYESPNPAGKDCSGLGGTYVASGCQAAVSWWTISAEVSSA